MPGIADRYVNKHKGEVMKYYSKHGTSKTSRKFDIPISTIQSWAKERNLQTKRLTPLKKREIALYFYANGLRETMEKYGLAKSTVYYARDFYEKWKYTKIKSAHNYIK